MSKHVTIVFDFDIKQFEGNPFNAGTPFGQPVGITNGDLQESAAVTEELGGALDELVKVVDAAGLDNLIKGVQLGPTVWYVKACDAMRRAKEALESYAGGAE